jgi:hypothetical protein
MDALLPETNFKNSPSELLLCRGGIGKLAENTFASYMKL